MECGRRESNPSLIKPAYVFGDFPPRGARVTPGKYTVRATAAGRTVTVAAEVRKDPNAAASPEDLTAQYAFLNQARRDLETIHETLRRIKDLKLQAREYARRAAAAGKGDDFRARADSVVKALEPIEDELYNPKLKTGQDSLNFLPKLDFQFAALAGMVDTGDSKPTAASHGRHKELKAQLDSLLARLRKAVDTEVAEFNRAAAAAGGTAIVVPTNK